MFAFRLQGEMSQLILMPTVESEGQMKDWQALLDFAGEGIFGKLEIS